MKKNRVFQRTLLNFIGIPLIFLIVSFIALLNINDVNTKGTLSILLILIAVNLGLCTWFLIYLYKNSQRISEVKTGIEDLANGKIVTKVNVRSNDEITKIGYLINKVSERLQYIADIGEKIITKKSVEIVPLSEHDELAYSMIKMKENLQNIEIEEKQRNWSAEGLARFSEILRTSKSVRELSEEVITRLVEYVKAVQGVVFVLENDNTGEEYLDLKGCYAYNRLKVISKRIIPGEGLIGQAFLEKETTLFKKIPENYIKISSGLGEANPRTLLLVPLLVNAEIVGVIELASFNHFEKHEISFLEKVGENIAHSIRAIKTAESTQKLLNDSLEQSSLLKSQEEELRQNQEELEATQEEISRKYDELFRNLAEMNNQSKFEQLRAINSNKKRNIEYYFNIIRNQISTFSENKMIVEAVKAFRSAYYKIEEETKVNLPEIEISLSKYYDEEFLTRLNDQAPISNNSLASKHIPQELRTKIYQYLYISNNPYPTGQKSSLDDPKDGSQYSKVHAYYHPLMRSFLEKFGYYDIFLLDSDTGDMLYSVFKEVDFATNLANGIYHQTNFGKVVKEVIQSEDREFIKLIDFEPYDPSYKAPASFIACPVYDENRKIGILVFQMPINKINQNLTGDNNWKEDGLGETGETIIVGHDFKLRSISRKLIEHEFDYFTALSKIGFEEELIRMIQKSKTSILLEEMKTESVRKAIQGKSGTIIEPNNFGVNTLQAYAPLDIKDVHWILLSIIEETEAAEAVNKLKRI